MKVLKVVDKYRVRKAENALMRGLPKHRCGMFKIPLKSGTTVKVIVDNGINEQRWEHVSVSVYQTNRTPTYEEMCEVKSLFFEDNETVLQFHPPKKEYVNIYKTCLHLWRYKDAYPMPPLTILESQYQIQLSSGVDVTVAKGSNSNWDRYSCSLPDRYLTWDEMCEIKNALFSDKERVIQIHSSAIEKSTTFCIDLWYYNEDLPHPIPSSVI